MIWYCRWARRGISGVGGVHDAVGHHSHLIDSDNGCDARLGSGVAMSEWGVARVASPGAEQAKLTVELAETCDRVLDAGGALIHAWKAAQGSVRPGQVPAAPAPIVGRDAELTALARALGQQRVGTPSVVAIDGPAGVGKTALALRLAHQVAENYVDGQLYADLGGFASSRQQAAAGHVLEGFLTAMGATSIPTTGQPQAVVARDLGVRWGRIPCRAQVVDVG
jgi:AAA ATPase domain